MFDAYPKAHESGRVSSAVILVAVPVDGPAIGQVSRKDAIGSLGAVLSRNRGSGHEGGKSEKEKARQMHFAFVVREL